MFSEQHLHLTGLKLAIVSFTQICGIRDDRVWSGFTLVETFNRFDLNLGGEVVSIEVGLH